MTIPAAHNSQHQILRISQLFSELDDSSLEAVASATTMRKADKGETIFLEGDLALSFFIVGFGKVKVFKMSPDGKEQILMIAGPGDSFAEAALFSGGRFPASAQALENSELLVLNRDRFVELLADNPDLGLNLIARLSELLRKLTRLVEGLALSDVTTRLAHYLEGLIDVDTNETQPVVTLTEKKTTLASQLGTIPETLSRSFAKLVKEKAITVDGPKITITDPDRLSAIASGE